MEGVSRRGVLWIAFAVVHLAVAVLGFLEPNAPMGDVYLVYEPWSGCTLMPSSEYCGIPPVWNIPGITDSWVYPQLALVPMLLAWLFAWLVSYTPAWAILVTLVDAGVFAALVGRGRSTGRRVGAWFWLAFIVLLGPVGMYRLEGVTVPLAILGCLWLVRRPWVASILLAVATWIKVWPAALIAAALIAVRRRLAILGGAAVVTAATLLVIATMGGLHNAFGFVGDQTTRGLQIEAPVSSFYLWGATLAFRGWDVNYDPEVLTFQVTGPNVDVVIALMTPLMLIAMLAIVALGAYKAWRGASFARLFPVLALSIVLAFIVFNKVGSPQYIAWIAAPLVLGLVVERDRWTRPGVLLLAIAFVTQLIYPLTYGGLMRRVPFIDPLPVTLLTIRNVLLVVMLAWMVARLARVPAHARSRFAARVRVPVPAAGTTLAPEPVLAGAGATLAPTEPGSTLAPTEPGSTLAPEFTASAVAPATGPVSVATASATLVSDSAASAVAPVTGSLPTAPSTGPVATTP